MESVDLVTQDGLLKVARAEEEGRRRIAFAGELDLATARTAELALAEALADGPNLVVDLRDLEFLDSTGIALLVAAMGRPHARLSFLPSDHHEVRRVLQVTGLTARMEITGAETSSSFSG